MDLNHLSDNELIEHVIKHDSDPVRVRLATHMQRVSGAIIDDLVYAGMDETFCNFHSVVNGSMYHPGQYIGHLENEIDYLGEQISKQQRELDKLKARTVAELIRDLNEQIETEKIHVRIARENEQKAQEKEREWRQKLDMWAIMNR